MISLFSDKRASPSGTPCPVRLTVPYFLLSSASFPLAPADSASSRGLATLSEQLLLLRSDLALHQSRCALRGHINKELAPIPAILITANRHIPQQQIQQRRLIALMKPFELDTFLATIETLLTAT